MNYWYHKQILLASVRELPAAELAQLIFLVYYKRCFRNHIFKKGEVIFHPKKLKGHPITIRRGTTDIDILLDLIAFERYMPEGSNDLEKVVFDLGANIGATTAHFAVAFPKAQIIAVELEHSNFNIALRNTSFAGQKVKLIQGAVWKSDEMVSFAGSKADAFAVSNKAASGIKANAYTMSSLCEKHAISEIDFVKMDIEGAEKQVILEGNTEWLKKVKKLTIEVHSAEYKEPIAQILSKYKFQVSETNKHWCGLAAHRSE